MEYKIISSEQTIIKELVKYSPSSNQVEVLKAAELIGIGKLAKNIIEYGFKQSLKTKADFDFKKVVSAIESKDPWQISTIFKKNAGWDIGIGALNKVPKELWESSKVLHSREGAGIRFISKSNDIRIMKGNPNALHASQQQDYVKIVSGGKVGLRDGRFVHSGEVKKGSHTPDSHIPLYEWLKWSKWNAK